ncbi:hypothetical protein V9T40_009616 [Parthenolecanium corni]|uniref:Uncharacterized protein n=1 Tax=Parthenolecanium corni TaxID=536013 RepID=A0AAN9TN44_9HEMI
MQILVNTILLMCVWWVQCQVNKFEEVFSWNIVDFQYASVAAREKAIKNRHFIRENNQPLGLEVWRNKLFVTFPPWRPGTVATLTYIDLEKANTKSPKFIPYPNWETHDLRNTTKGNKLANVIRLHVDICDRLWVADRGIINILTTRDKIHDAKIVGYDLKTDRVFKQHSLPDDAINVNSFFGNILADVSGNDCSKTHVYVPDLRANAIFVYSIELNRIWRVEHHYFHFDPLSGDYLVGDTTFQWTDGVIGVSLSRPRPDGYRLLYFTPMSSSRLYSVSTKVLQDYTVDWSAWNNTALFHQFQVVGYRGQFMQSTTSTIDENTGVLFYTLLCQDAIACWNSQSEYNMNTQGIVAQDSKRFSYTNDVKVDKNGMIWALSDRLHEYLFNKMNYSEINFRIFRIPVMAAIQGTVCEKGFLQSQDVMWK